MKSQIPELMKERGLDAIVVLGGGVDNPAMTYLTGLARLMRSVYVMRANGDSLLVHNPMERDEVRETGLPTMDFVQAGLKKFSEEERSDVAGEARMVAHVLERLGAKGKVAFYGRVEANRFLAQVELIEKRSDGIEVQMDAERSIFDVARMTKDASEIEKMREVGRRTCGALGAVRDLLFSCKVKGNEVIRPDGERLKLGHLREVLRKGLTVGGLVERSGTIISMGRDSAVPHNFGNDAEDVRPGKTIVMDVFPGEVGGGYAFDITRTYCVGQVPDEVRKVYEDVREAHKLSIEGLKVGTFSRIYQDKVCDFFEGRGYTTIRQNEGTEEGYVHGLGHGIGLEVHEKPRLGGTQANEDKILPGSVFTVEPGLYFPDKAIGVRIEDIVFAKEDGTFEVLVDFPRELSPPLA